MSDKRKVIHGVPISSGIVLGTAHVVMPGDFRIVDSPVPATRVNREIAALEDAVEKTIAELSEMRKVAVRKIGGPVAKIFDAQLLIAGDYEFLQKVKNEIRSRKRTAASVYNKLVRNATNPLKNSPDHYLRQMAIDIEAVASRVLSHLIGNSVSKDTHLAPNTIVVGRAFTPNDVMAYRELKAVGFIVSRGGADSHMALIARSLMVPVIQTEQCCKIIPNGSRLIADGTTGDIIINPTPEEWSEYQRRRKRLGPTMIARIRRLPKIPPVTRDGKEMGIGANLSLPGPADDILAERQIPVGLYRTEFLYMAGNKFPDEETQYRTYLRIAEKFAPAPVVLRTFDLGYDKLGNGADWLHEDNPALGWRGIRAMLDMSQVFKTQVRAMLRASVQKNIKIMLPMITDLWEVERAKKYIAQVKLKLRRDGIPYDPGIQVGIMIEVPAAAMTADTLAKKVDFISIGTNDLTQYTMAADRTNNRVNNLYSPFHPAVLHLVALTVEACKKNNIPVSICGELAGDVLAIPLFIGMGVDLLSMSPSRIVDACRMINKVDSTLVRHLVTSVVSSGSLQAAINRLKDYKAAFEQRK